MNAENGVRACANHSAPAEPASVTKYNALLKKGANHPIEKTGAKLRALMPWMGKKNIKGAQAAY